MCGWVDEVSRLAFDPEELTDARDIVRRLRPISFRRPGRTDRTAVGLVAEEVRGIAPDLVTAATDGALGLRSLDIAVLAVAAIAEQQQRIDELERTVEALATRSKPEFDSHPELAAGPPTG